MDLSLVRGQTVLARITHAEPDQPWFDADFAPTADFESVRPMFERASDLLQREAWADWEDSWDDMRDAGVRLRFDDSHEVEEFVLHVEGTRCRFRY